MQTLDLNAAELNQRLAAVQLYKALGGGWNPTRQRPFPLKSRPAPDDYFMVWIAKRR